MQGATAATEAGKDSQRAMIATEAEKLYSIEAKERQGQRNDLKADIKANLNEQQTAKSIYSEKEIIRMQKLLFMFDG